MIQNFATATVRRRDGGLGACFTLFHHCVSSLRDVAEIRYNCIKRVRSLKMLVAYPCPRSEGLQDAQNHESKCELYFDRNRFENRAYLRPPEAVLTLANDGDVLFWNSQNEWFEVIDGRKFEEEFDALRCVRAKRKAGAVNRPFARMHVYFDLVKGEKWASTGSAFRPRHSFFQVFLSPQIQGNVLNTASILFQIIKQSNIGARNIFRSEGTDGDEISGPEAKFNYPCCSLNVSGSDSEVGDFLTNSPLSIFYVRFALSLHPKPLLHSRTHFSAFTISHSCAAQTRLQPPGVEDGGAVAGSPPVTDDDGGGGVGGGGGKGGWCAPPRPWRAATVPAVIVQLAGEGRALQWDESHQWYEVRSPPLRLRRPPRRPPPRRARARARSRPRPSPEPTLAQRSRRGC